VPGGAAAGAARQPGAWFDPFVVTTELAAEFLAALVARTAAECHTGTTIAEPVTAIFGTTFHGATSLGAHSGAAVVGTGTALAAERPFFERRLAARDAAVATGT
jgi:hypothetical protein